MAQSNADREKFLQEHHVSSPQALDAPDLHLTLIMGITFSQAAQRT